MKEYDPIRHLDLADKRQFRAFLVLFLYAGTRRSSAMECGGVMGSWLATVTIAQSMQHQSEGKFLPEGGVLLPANARQRGNAAVGAAFW